MMTYKNILLHFYYNAFADECKTRNSIACSQRIFYCFESLAMRKVSKLLHVSFARSAHMFIVAKRKVRLLEGLHKLSVVVEKRKTSLDMCAVHMTLSNVSYLNINSSRCDLFFFLHSTCPLYL